MLALKLSLLLTTLSSQIFKNMLLNHSKTSICVTALIASVAFSVSIQQTTFSQKPEKHSNKIIYLLNNFEELQMFSMRRLPVRLQMFSFYKKIICVENRSVFFITFG